MSDTAKIQLIVFWDKKAARYSKQPVADEAAYQKKLQVTRDYFQPDMEILEIGCRTGSTAITHAPYVKHIRAIGSDAALNWSTGSTTGSSSKSIEMTWDLLS